MATMQRFEDSTAWQTARELVKSVYDVPRQEPFRSDWGLRDQIQRASVSIMCNIAEGFERGSNKEFIQFLYLAKGSSGEVRSLLYAALDQAYITRAESDERLRLCTRTSVKLNNLIAYLKKSGLKGHKFHEGSDD